MTTDVVTIPREEFELLKRCKSIVESDFEEEFTSEFVNKIKAIERDIASGKKISFRSKEELNEHLEQL